MKSRGHLSLGKVQQLLSDATALMVRGDKQLFEPISMKREKAD